MEYSPLFLGYTRDHKGKVVSHNLKDISNTIVASNHGRNGSTAQYLVEPMIYSSPHGFNFGGGKNLAPTITSSAYADNNFLVKDFRIRKLTLATQSWSPASTMCSARCSSTIPTNRKDMCSSHSSKLKTSTMSQLYIFAT